ncbi:MAG: hypothetical protein D4R92_03905 [Actinobacteria bacterium]|nr:MAG: hypothetical protein D4R92_03905 [Actinomycetota bacterium]
MRFDEQLESFKQDGTLSAEQAEMLRNATRFPINSTEVVSILGGFFIILGTFWFIAPLLSDISQLLVAIALYLVSGLLAFATRSLIRKVQFKNAAEVVEVLAVTSFAIATGIVVSQTSATTELSIFIASISVLVYGFLISSKRKFSGSFLLSASATVMTISGLAVLDAVENTAGFCLVAVGSVLLWFAQKTNVRGKFTLRFFATCIVVLGLIFPRPDFGLDIIAVLISMIFAIALFGYGIKTLFTEVVVISGIGLVVVQIELVITITDDSGLQGLATLLTGGVIVLFSLRKLRADRNKTLS